MNIKMLTPTTLKKGLILGKNALIEQSPIILTIAAVGGVAATIFMAVKATTHAEKIIAARKEELEIEPDAPLPVKEVVQSCWRVYLPTAISAGLTITAIIGACAINEKRKAALASLYALSETALKEYQEKTEEIAGKTMAGKIQDEVNKSHTPSVAEYPDCPPWEDYAGVVRVKDSMTGRLFWSSIQKMREAALEINENIQSGDFMASLNDFYEILGLQPCEFGMETGWSINHLCKPYFTSTISLEGTPIVILDWDRNGRPSYDYREI